MDCGRILLTSWFRPIAKLGASFTPRTATETVALAVRAPVADRVAEAVGAEEVASGV
jgi:hypothetical protein